MRGTHWQDLSHLEWHLLAMHDQAEYGYDGNANPVSPIGAWVAVVQSMFESDGHASTYVVGEQHATSAEAKAQ